MQEKRVRRTFSPEFKQRAVEKVLRDGQPVVEVARDLDINRVSLDNWIKAAKEKGFNFFSANPKEVQETPTPELVQVETKPQPAQAEEPLPLTQVETVSEKQEEPELPKPMARKTITLKPGFKRQPRQEPKDLLSGYLFEDPTPTKDSPKEASFESSPETIPQETIVEVSPVAETLSEQPNERFSSSEEGVSKPSDDQPRNDFRPQRQNRQDRGFQKKNKQDRWAQKNQNKAPVDDVDGNFASADQQPEYVPEVPVQKRRATGSRYFVEGALDQFPSYKERNESLGYQDTFQVYAKTLEDIWIILQTIKENTDRKAFAKWVAQQGLNVSDELLANPRQKNLSNDTRQQRKPWQKQTPRMDPIAQDFFKTVPDYAKSVYEYVGPLCLRLGPNSVISPVLACEGNEDTGWVMDVDFSKFDRFVDEFYGGFVNECKTILMQKNPKEYHSLNAFIRYPDHPAWNPKLWAGERTVRVAPRESFAHAWLRSINEI